MEPRGDLENLVSALHGDVAASLLDNALGAAVQSLLPAGARSATLNLNVSYLRGLNVRSGTIRARGRLTRGGSLIPRLSYTLSVRSEPS